MAESWKLYPLNCSAYERDSEKGDSLKGKFDDYSAFGDPNEETTYAIGFTEDGQNLFTELLSEEQIANYLSTVAESFGSLAVYQFFFNLQPGGSNRIYTRCMRKLLSSLQISPSFPVLVGNSHVTAFGSRLIRSPIDASPQLHETWFSITSPRLWPTASVNAIAIEQRDGLFDSIPLPHLGLTILMWRMSVYIRYNHKDRTVVILGLDEGGKFRENRLPDTMAQSVELHMRENPFSLHLLFLSEALHDWTLCFEALQKEFKQEEAAVFESEHIDYATKLRRFHQLSAHQLKYQKDVMAFPDVLDGVEKEHNRFKLQVDLPDHIYQRVDENLYRIKQLAWSNQHHSSRMERQTKNIQDMLIHLITLENEISIRAHTDTMQQNIHQMTTLSTQNVAILRETKDLSSRMHTTLQETQKISDDSKTLSFQNGAILSQSKDLSLKMHMTLQEMQKISQDSKILASTMSETLTRSDKILGFMKTVAAESRNQSEEMMAIARETREHSSTMKLVAVISMVFLPPTFICTFFSMQAFKFSLPDQDQQVTFSPGLWVPLTSCLLVLLVTLAVFYYPRVQKRWVEKKEIVDGKDEEVGSLRRHHTAPGDRHVPGSFVPSAENAIPLEDLSTSNNVDPVVEEGSPAASETTPEVTVEVISSEVIDEEPPSATARIQTPPPPPIELNNPTNESIEHTEVVLEGPSPNPNIQINNHVIPNGLEVAVSDSQSSLPSPLSSPSLLPVEVGNGKVNDMRDAASRRRRILGEGSGQGRHS